MFYFILRWGLSLSFTALLVLLFLFVSRRYAREEAKRPYQVFLPSCAALLLSCQVVLSSAPKTLDLIALLRNNLSFTRIQVSDRRSVWGTVKTSENELYYYNPLHRRPDPGASYTISFTPYEHFIISIEEREAGPQAQEATGAATLTTSASDSQGQSRPGTEP